MAPFSRLFNVRQVPHHRILAMTVALLFGLLVSFAGAQSTSHKKVKKYLSEIQRHLLKSYAFPGEFRPEDLLDEGRRELVRVLKRQNGKRLNLPDPVAQDLLDRLNNRTLQSIGNLIRRIRKTEQAFPEQPVDLVAIADTFARGMIDATGDSFSQVLTLEDIREPHEERLKDLRDQTGLLALVMDEAPVLFSEPEEGRLQFEGTENILTQPEFQEPDDVRRLIEIIEDEDRVVQVLENLFESDPEAVGTATIRIGGESDEEEMDAYSIVTSPYQLGGTIGTLGVIGPTRMDYARAVALVENAANVINRPADESPPSKPDPSAAS